MSSLIDQLRWYKEHNDRGFFANLRSYLIESKRQRAWPALYRLNVPIEDEAQSYIAAWYSMHPEETQEGNLGTTCRIIQNKTQGKQSTDNNLTPMERRFLQLLASGDERELRNRITRIILMAKSQQVPVNYEQLKIDSNNWNQKTKISWAQAFWAANATLPGKQEEKRRSNELAH
ncbi:MAG TPA: type I-E CRISPR-associated protein Cse2/CasB [Rectinema sp.]|jgi:CRISPR system Cascade subunit CasB|nr:type I-E CRISPR-associated protein Cse2/CasB [Rectinema sp.]HOO02552.1 type I-E CRISPR-associated protein Cse2/CasB [Rectinema sp.]HPW02059.1 type I-E CRISPR-associated protein Cse2/CasB [Rectinema sp.]HPW46914.1 type I-E CRISPR-associated protein Cse2/CasB [Rectinema sp.]HQN03457.1 type I-E CRISPR-associated protein Cse2/CasB [Rectinema sp.]